MANPMTRKTKTRKPLTLAVVRKKLHRELREIRRNHKRHREAFCDSPLNCLKCKFIRGMITAWENAIKLAGGRVNE